MTVLQRTAATAAMFFAITGVSLSAAGNAAETAVRASAAAITVEATLPTVSIVQPAATLPVPALVADAAVAAAPVVAFASLAAAVDAHDEVGTESAALDEQVRCLAGAIYFESKGEPLHGQLGVAEVIIARSGSGRFPPGICSVVTQPGQFSFVRGGRIPAIDESRPAYRTAVAVARVALKELWSSPAAGSLYFNARRAPAAGLRRVASIGHHIFYR